MVKDMTHCCSEIKKSQERERERCGALAGWMDREFETEGRAGRDLCRAIAHLASGIRKRLPLSGTFRTA